jgi:hypothetical protein
VAVNKKKAKADFEALGLWPQFVHYREWLVACGMVRLEAWEQAVDVAHRLVERFGPEVAGSSLVGMVKGEECPLDAEPEVVPESPAVPTVVAAESLCPGDPVLIPAAAPPAEPLTFKGYPIQMEPFLPGTAPSIPTPDAPPALHPAAPAPLKTPRAPRPPAPPPKANELPENVDRKLFYKPQASPREAVEWVAANIAVSDVQPGDCPGPEAWGLLCWARKNEGNLNTFWTSHYPKLMPSKSENENAGRRRDNVDAIKELIGAVEDAGRAAVENSN